METPKSKKKTESQRDPGASFQDEEDTSYDSKMDRYLEMMSQAHLSTQEHLKNTQTILGKIVEVNNNLTSIITNTIQVNTSQEYPESFENSFVGERSDAQQKFKNAYPRLRTI